jgi:hypothetical protein
MATRIQFDRIPSNLRASKVITQTPYGQRAADMALSRSVQGLRGLLPSTQGTQGIQDVRLYGAAKRTGDIVSALETVDSAANGSDPDLAAYAQELLQDPRFLKCISEQLTAISAAIQSAHPAAANAGAAPAANTDPTAENPDPAAESELPSMAREGGGAKPEENFDPQDTTTKMNGADGMPPTAPNSFTPKHLERALEVRNFAPHYHLSKNPHVGMDAARQAVSQMQFVPAWDSNVWTDAARADYRARAITNGEIARHLAQFGVEPMDNKGKTLAIPVWNMPDGPIRRYFENE